MRKDELENLAEGRHRENKKDSKTAPYLPNELVHMLEEQGLWL